jgi:hypothetical protein
LPLPLPLHTRKVTKNKIVTQWSARFPTLLEDEAYERALQAITKHTDLSAIGRNKTPGADNARRDGCTCCPIRNSYGAGRSFGDTPFARPVFTIDPMCPMHAEGCP